MGPHLRLGLSLDLGLDLLPTLARSAEHPPPTPTPSTQHPPHPTPTPLTHPSRVPLSSLVRLVDSEYEDYLLCGLTALSELTRAR